MQARPENSGKRRWIYPATVKGRFQRIHRISGVALQAILFVTPWILIGGHPAVQFDLPGRRLHLLGMSFTPSDSIFLVLMGLFAAFLLFFVTSLFGRLWCGFACPQTVFLEEWVRPIEKLIEGERGVRMRRDQGPWTFDKAWRKVAKWSAFTVLSAVVSMGLMSYFSGARELWTGQASSVSYSLVGAFAVVLLADFGWFREQFCNYLCPYARFQGALTDEHSLVVAYDTARGEPRGPKRKNGAAVADTGACIDCNKCVAVCPTGIDIRDGFQLECITCARCVDACDAVMTRLGEENLVRFSTVAETVGKETSWLRPRTVAYATLLTGIAIAFFALGAARHDIEATVNRSPGSLYVVDADGWTRNTYMVKVTNNHPGEGAVLFDLEVVGIEGAEIIAPPIRVAADQSITVPMVVRAPPGSALRTMPLRIELSTDFDRVVVDATFKSGADNRG